MSEVKKYTYDQVREASISYFNGDELAGEVFAGKYALQDLEGNYYELTPADMHRRLAKEFARIEKKYDNPMSEEEIFKLLSTWSVVPQGSPMSGIGNPFQVQSISNCFVIDAPHDSYGGIMKTDEEGAQIMKRRGGVGNDISTIRPKGMHTANAARTTDGIGVFMQRFSNTTREVAQGGRRGARMLTISVHHPEIDTFIQIKKDRKLVTGANISIRVSDDFMRAVVADKEYEQRWPVDAKNPKISKMVRAKEVWDKMMEAAWDSAEPGILFWDRIINDGPADRYADVGFKTQSTNPCGELPLPDGDSCRLLLMNLFKYVLQPYTNVSSFDFNSFYHDTVKAQRLMDDLVDLELEMIERIISKIMNDDEPDEVKRRERLLWERIRKVTSDGRRTGLGITALGDTIAALGFKYGSYESIGITGDVYRNLAAASYESSIIMAKERGSFPVFDHKKEESDTFVNRILEILDGDVESMYEQYGRRNIANLTTSPAGTLSILTQTTSGCEPAIYLEYMRRKKINPNDKQARVDFVDPSGDKWQEYPVFHHGHKLWAAEWGLDPSKDKADSPYHGCTATEIDPSTKVVLQAAAQKWIDHSISNTVNLKQDTPVEKVSEIYLQAWEMGCKGLTVYREGSRAGVLVPLDEKKKQENKIAETHSPKRPQELPCDIHVVKVGGKDHLLLVGLLENKPYEIFFGEANNFDVTKKQKSGTIVKSKSGTKNSYALKVEDNVYENIVDLFDNPNHGAFTRTISTSLRHGIPVKYLVEQLRKDKHSDLWSFSSVIARVLSKNYISDGTKADGLKCAACSSTNVVYLQGCATCLDCGSSKCS